MASIYAMLTIRRWSNGGVSIGSTYIGTAPPANGLLVQGNVGIGNSNPIYKFCVNGGANINVVTRPATDLGGANGIALHSLNDAMDTTQEIMLAGNPISFIGGAVKMADAGVWSTGGGSALLGANCPAVTVAAPHSWMKVIGNDNDDLYVPCWK